MLCETRRHDPLFEKWYMCWERSPQLSVLYLHFVCLFVKLTVRLSASSSALSPSLCTSDLHVCRTCTVSEEFLSVHAVRLRRTSHLIISATDAWRGCFPSGAFALEERVGGCVSIEWTERKRCGARQVEDSRLNVDLGDVVKENRGLSCRGWTQERYPVPVLEKRSIQLARKDGDGRRSNLRRCWDCRRSCSCVGGSRSLQRQRAEGIGRSGLREVWTDGVAGAEGRCGISLAGPCCACINESKARVEKAECTEIDKKVMVSFGA